MKCTSSTEPTTSPTAAQRGPSITSPIKRNDKRLKTDRKIIENTTRQLPSTNIDGKLKIVTLVISLGMRSRGKEEVKLDDSILIIPEMDTSFSLIWR